ncbi:asparagine synthase (glutamine-hydrolyzing) [Flavisolibacter ginsengisoli]|jgi:asparagine synthase (glutamine-hydrolysing)|uniref:asparagine synthase (glutamine-hydrolyzing) n=1 Tax=Flavisolibacter ginsengisoli DSM 18119 TaxID=1121884 RepID=A0A1M4VH73_9BACT|nr:asparagine synthase (glutamine-hydrolyzing) [Flavisolibacter ginsengisoli]SHE68361.1 asparagine synthase (glutamine-hydrolysing) [Flavisolibacter ginsengisoli DSM 18119]
MCGIAGFIDFKNRSTEDVLSEMAAALSHRGPDGQGTYFQQLQYAQLGLGHRRLSIIDLSHAADQPMHYDGLHIIFNGEIYNYNEIRDQLIQKGHQFQTHSDTEVILHAWREWGEQAIEQWHGMFAIALFDERSNELICIRDRAGVKPFYYYWKDDTFLFGSELKSLIAHPAFIKQIDRDAVASYLQYGYIAHPNCIYSNTYKLPAGHLLRLELDLKLVNTVQYWNVYDHYNKPKLQIDLPEAIEETEKILEKAFQFRMVADVPVGVFLSGGYDSTCVTALLQKNSTERIKTFTIGTTDNKLDEAPFAKQIADQLCTDHTEYYCTPKEALDIIPGLPYYYDEPFADSSAIPTMLVSRMARQNVTVALSADAGDEIFAGYNRYDYIFRYGRKINALPRPVRQLAVAAMSGISSKRIPYWRNQPNFHSRYDKLKNILADPSPSELLKNLNQVFNDKEIEELFANHVTELNTSHNSSELLNMDQDPLAYMMAIDYQTYMVDDILQKVDRATMAVSLEGREPFLDQDIIEWAAQLPSSYKYYEGQKKYILKQIVHKYIPKEIMERPKMGFGIPVDNWLSHELKDLVEEHLSEASLKLHGLFNVQEVRNIVSDFLNGRKEKHLKVWYLLMFQMWYKQWM